MSDYYVSPNGSDSASGSIAAPFQTAIKGLGTTRAGDRLILREGIYRGNSGWFPGNATEIAPISIEAYPGEKVTLSGLSRIKSWQPFDLSGGKAIYRALMPFTMCGASTAIAGEDFIISNGIPINEAQWPPADNSQYPQKASNWATVDGGAWLTSPSTKNAVVTVQIQDSALTVFPDGSLIGSRITLLPGARWALVSGTVSANAGDKLTFSIKSPGGLSYYTPDSRSLYFLFGKSVFLSSPGSWWRDPDSNYLYLWLPDSSDPNNAVIEAKKDSRILDFYGRSHYRFKNLMFAGGPLNITTASNLKFENCTFKWYSHRLYLDTMWGWVPPALYVNRDKIEIYDCDFVDAVGNIIFPESQQGLIVKNCVLYNTGGITFAGVNSKFIQNTINSCPGGCFKLTGNVAGTEVSYNDLGRTGDVFTDGGVLLVERHTTGAGRISRNFLHDGLAPSDGSKEFYGTAGFYFEAPVVDLVFDHNIVCRTTSPSVNLVPNAGQAITNLKFFNNTCDGSIYWIPVWAGNPTYPGVKLLNNYFKAQAPNTGQHPDIQFVKNAFKTIPVFLNATDNIQTPNPNFDADYFLGINSPLRSIAQPITGITTDPFPDIGAREGVLWKAGATVRVSDISALTIASYQVDGDRVVFSIGNIPFGRHLGSNYKMKLGSGSESAGTVVPYSITAGRTVWARIDSGTWLAIGQIAVPPTLQSLSSGAGLPGEAVEIIGSDFQASAAVLLGDGSELTADSVSANKLEITVPDGTDVGILQLRVVNPDGQKSQSASFSVLSALSLVSLSATVVGPGQRIELTGTGFVAGAIAVFGSDTEVSVDFSSSTSLGVQVPIVAPGATTVKIVNPGAIESEVLPLTVVVLPSIASFSPNPIRPGQELAVVGENFGGDPYLSISGFEVIPIAFTETSLVAIVPANAPAGTVQFRIVSEEVGASTPVNLVVQRPPVLLSIVTPSAPIGARIGLTGSDLTADCQIFFGETAGLAPVFSGTTASAAIPAISAGIVGVKVVSAQGLESAEIDFEVLPRPAISSIVPATAPVNELISIVGENFAIGVLVFFAGMQIQSGATRVSDTEIQITVPNRSPGTYTIRVENPDGGVSENISFLVQGRPLVLGITPVKALPGTVVSISGAHFEPGAEIRFKNLLLPAQVLGAGGLSFSVPVIAPEAVVISVRNPTGLESDPVDFEVLAVPIISTAVPNSAVADDLIAISGTHFKPDIKLYLNNQQVEVVRESSTSLKFEVPAQIFGIFSLRVFNATDNLSSLSVGFTVLRKPKILVITPTAAQPGATIKIFGTDFEDPALLVDGSSMPFAYVGGAMAFVLPQYPPGTILSIRVRNSSSVLSEPVGLIVLAPISLYSAVPPTSAPKTTVELQGSFFPTDARVFFGNVEAQVTAVVSNRLSVRVPNLPAIPTVIKVWTPAGAVSITAIPFDVLPSLAVFQITPNPAPPGTEIEITGSGFDEGVAVFVRNVQVIDLVRVSDTQLKLKVPQLSPGGTQIKIVLPDDRQTFFDFTVPAVWISNISHTVIRVGEWLEITGTGFVQPLAVTVGGVAATEVVVISPTLIKVRVPPFLVNTI